MPIFYLHILTFYRIACISCPTLYAKLIQIKPTDCKAVLLEYDQRFEVYGDDFVFYDYTKPLNFPEHLSEKSFDIVVADPPYLSDECLRKTAQTITFLTRGKILLCTGKPSIFMCTNEPVIWIPLGYKKVSD